MRLWVYFGFTHARLQYFSSTSRLAKKCQVTDLPSDALSKSIGCNAKRAEQIVYKKTGVPKVAPQWRLGHSSNSNTCYNIMFGEKKMAVSPGLFSRPHDDRSTGATFSLNLLIYLQLPSDSSSFSVFDLWKPRFHSIIVEHYPESCQVLPPGKVANLEACLAFSDHDRDSDGT